MMRSAMICGSAADVLKSKFVCVQLLLYKGPCFMVAFWASLRHATFLWTQLPLRLVGAWSKRNVPAQWYCARSKEESGHWD